MIRIILEEIKNKRSSVEYFFYLDYTTPVKPPLRKHEYRPIFRSEKM